jgi:uncharacterized membrane protein
MESVLDFIQRLDLHPVADHFTIALLTIAVLIDLLASLAPTRTWIRYMALTLMILGALAAGSSYATGDMETDRISKALTEPAKKILETHAWLGEVLAISFGVLALWRILIEGLGFFAGSRPVYLIVAIVGVLALFYQGHLGGQLVFDYGAGTALMAATPGAQASPEATATPGSALPTVSIPTPMSTFSPASTAPSPGPLTTAPTPSMAPSASPGGTNM